MKPLKSETQDVRALEEIGRASVQIVHDLKNQLNGLKLYATFLRKRMEKSERPADEQETVAKLISGLERAAGDMSTLVRLGRPLELRTQPRTDLRRILQGLEEEGLGVDAGPDELSGDFDLAALAEAFRAISSCALNLPRAEEAGEVKVQAGTAPEGRGALVEWRGVKIDNGDDPFKSFAGSEGLRMSLAAKIVEAHGGEAGHGPDSLRVILPLEKQS